MTKCYFLGPLSYHLLLVCCCFYWHSLKNNNHKASCQSCTLVALWSWRGRSSSIWKLSQTLRSLLRGWHVPMLFPVTSHTYTHTNQNMWHRVRLLPHTHRVNSHLCVFLLPHPAGVNQTHGWRRKQKGRWQNKKRKGKLSFSTCQSWGCQSVTRILTIIGCHHSVIRTASGETVGRRAEDWQSSPSSPYSSAGRVTFVIYTHSAVLEGSKSNMSEEPCATLSECYRHTEAQRV